ncbi:fimbrial biogenesis chaperone [Tatumella saanichensis]|uniref:fimbrial biogenesis chaperone n=1 Tax=Tatumella saanichensis TaxID=480813 RepID=UPI0004A47400|nr:molecular chaperone [Tatumella saanichensis]
MKVRHLISGIAIAGLFTAHAYAGISLDRTRMVITENDRSVSATLSNTSPDIPFLAQSWLEDSEGKKITSPLVVLPPLQRINGGQKGIAKINKTAGSLNLPQDRESLFYLNVREIPPKPKKENTLQLAMQSRIKVFYRPKAVIPKNKSVIWQDQLVFTKKGTSGFKLENPTPYYVTVLGLSKKLQKEGGGSLTSFPGMMIAPKSSTEITVSDNKLNEFSIMYVNDYGGHPELKFSCQNAVCRALPQDQQPR